MKRNRGLSVSLSLYKDYDDEVVKALPLAVGHFDFMRIKVPSLREKPGAIEHPAFRAAIETAVNAKMGVVAVRNVWDRWLDDSSPDAVFDYQWYRNSIEEVQGLAARLTEIYQWVIRSGLDGEPMKKSPQLYIRDHWLSKYHKPMADAVECAVGLAGIVDVISPCDSFEPDRFTWRMQPLGAEKHSRKTYYQEPLVDSDGNTIFLIPNCIPPAGYEHTVHYYQHWVTMVNGVKGVSIGTALSFDQCSLRHIKRNGFLECQGNIICCSRVELPAILGHIQELSSNATA